MKYFNLLYNCNKLFCNFALSIQKTTRTIYVTQLILMNSYDFYYAIGHIQVFCYLFPLIFCWKVRSKLFFSDKLFAIFLLSHLLLDLWALYHLHFGHSNLFIYNISTLLGLTFGTIWFPKVINNFEWQKWARYIGLALILSWILYSYTFQKYNEIYSEINMGYSVYMTIFASLGLFGILTQGSKSKKEQISNYYFFLGLFITHCISGLFRLFESQIIDLDQSLACTFESIDTFLIIVGIFLFTVAFYFKAGTKRQ
jgi:hypothetical protein